MLYILKNKNKDLIYFEINDFKEFKNQQFLPILGYNYIKNIEILVDKQYLPIGVFDLKSLQSWIMERRVPNHRYYVNCLLELITDNLEYIDFSYSLSLNDSFWILPEKKYNLKWEDVNLYTQNNFEKEISMTSLLGQRLKNFEKRFYITPEFTTNGMLPKCWIKDNDLIYLYKGNSYSKLNMGGKEVFCEYYLSQILEILKFNYIPYGITNYKDKLFSTCLLETNENQGYEPIWKFINPKNFEKDKNLELFNNCLEIYKNCNQEKQFYDMLLFDALVYNIDRHFGNFGMIINNENNQILKPFPIFDNGLSLFNFYSFEELDNLEQATSKLNLTSQFDISFDKQLQLAVKPYHKENLEKLLNFEFIPHLKFNLKTKWLKNIAKLIKKRVNLALNYLN